MFLAMNPKSIVERLGGVNQVARLCECSPQAVSQWFGVHPVTKRARTIPNARLLYLKAIRPDVFVEPERDQAQGDVAEAKAAEQV